MTKQIWAIIVVIILIIAGVWYYQTNQPVPAAGEPIKIGFIGPLTGFGAVWGEEQKNVINIAVEEINTTGGIDGRLLEFLFEDGKCDGKDAATAAQKLINIDKVKIVMPSCTSEALAVAPISESNKVLQLAVWPTGTDYSGIGQYTFRNSYSDEDTSRITADVISKKYTKVGIITESTNYAVGLRDSFKKYFTGQIYEENFQHNQLDIRTQVSKILAQKPEAVFVNPDQPATGLAILNQLKQQGFTGQIYGNFFGGSSEVIKSPDAEGMIFVADPVVKEGSKKDKLFKEYVKKYSKKPDFEFAVSAQYDAVYILKQAIEAVGENPGDLKDYLHNLKDFEGVLGTYGFNEKGDAVGLIPAAKQIKNGEIVDYKE